MNASIDYEVKHSLIKMESVAESRLSQPLRPIAMNKVQLTEALSKKTETSKVAAGAAIDALVEIITTAVAKGEDVALVGFGTFKSAKRAARTGRNPQTGAALKIAASTVPKFTAGATFKAKVAGKKAAKKK